MKYLKSFKINESSEITDDVVYDFFNEYYDRDKDNIQIKDVYIKNNRIVDVTRYVKDSKEYQKAKLVNIKIAQGDGIYLPAGRSLNNLSVLSDILSDLERFYAMNDEEICYTINNRLSTVEIEFIIKGGNLEEDASSRKEIDELFKELTAIYKKKGFRPTIKNNWFELRTSGKKSWSHYGDYSVDLRSVFSKIKSGEYTVQNQPRWHKIIEWYAKVVEKGLTLYITGGDHQFVLKII
jgi:hypothetical protein